MGLTNRTCFFTYAHAGRNTSEFYLVQIMSWLLDISPIATKSEGGKTATKMKQMKAEMKGCVCVCVCVCVSRLQHAVALHIHDMISG